MPIHFWHFFCVAFQAFQLRSRYHPSVCAHFMPSVYTALFYPCTVSCNAGMCEIFDSKSAIQTSQPSWESDGNPGNKTLNRPTNYLQTKSKKPKKPRPSLKASKPQSLKGASHLLDTHVCICCFHLRSSGLGHTSSGP